MKTRPEIPDEEIRSYMDFNQLIRTHESLMVRRNKFNFLNKILVISFALVTSSLVLYYYNANDATEEHQSSQDNTPAIQPPSVDPQHSNSLPEGNEHQPVVPSTDNLEVKSGDKEKETPSPKDTPIVEEKLSPGEAQPEYTFVEAEPIDGYPNLYDYFNRELKYPAEALGDSLQGMVTVSVVINEKGQPEKIEITNSLGEPFDREVRSVIDNMPPWKPASVNGKPVSSKIAIPLTFQVKKIKNSESK